VPAPSGRAPVSEAPVAPAGRLAGRTAVVTGASRGIGLATAQALAAEGARVAMLARSGHALAAAAAAVGPGAAAVPCDVSDAIALRSAVAEIVERFGAPPDVLVSNAGRFTLAPVEATSAEDFTATLDTNLVAPFILARAFVPGMRARGSGTVVTVGSIADRVTFPENGAYAASKHGLRALHEVLRAELRGSGVRAVLVSPGPVDTPLWDAVDPDTREGFTPRAAMLAAAAVADAILFAVTRPAGVNIDELRLSRS
jgi:NAD(P)-dependent dehydrogenase (short-subunit alcohol dehydrogenase family)